MEQVIYYPPSNVWLVHWVVESLLLILILVFLALIRPKLWIQQEAVFVELFILL